MNPALDNTGMKQAEALGTLFANVAWARVIASPLQRARQTAAPIARAVGVELEAMDGFNDRDYGQWAGEVRRDIEARFGSIDQAPGVEG